MPDAMEDKVINELLVSVVIPYFNDGLYIDEAVDSILNQTYKNVEIIIINDASTDLFSIEKITNYQKPKTRVIHHPINQHLSAARNTGFRHANSEYVLTLDADDMFEATFIEKAVKILDERPEVGAVSAWAKAFGVLEFLWKGKGQGLDNFILGNNSVACALIRKKAWEQVGGYQEEMKKGCEDWEFWIRVTAKGYLIDIIQEPIFLYRQKRQSMRLDTESMLIDMYSQIVQLNKDIFTPYWLDIVLKLIDDIKNLNKEKAANETALSNYNNLTHDQFIKSLDYKVGKFILYPFRLIKSKFQQYI
jgi:glycosyltransferase involved in cell wall biosynthesis